MPFFRDLSVVSSDESSVLFPSCRTHPYRELGEKEKREFWVTLWSVR